MDHGAAPATPMGDRESVLPWRGAPPQAPSFTASVDQHAGVIRTRGHLDALAADLLAGSVVALQRLGHRRITVRVGPQATIDDDARGVLADLDGRLSADGARLVVE